VAVIQARLCETGFLSRQGKEFFFLCATAPRHSTPLIGFWGTVSPKVRRPESEAKRLRGSSVKVTNCAKLQLPKNRVQFYFNVHSDVHFQNDTNGPLTF
jgi:hypothetical protein